jgi:hypothetical protein
MELIPCPISRQKRIRGSRATPFQKTKVSARRLEYLRQKRMYLFVKNILSPNAGFTCKDVWRGPGASQVRDERLCLVQTLVMFYRHPKQ